MTDAQHTQEQCPGCHSPVDPLRSPAVSVVEGRITHFCSRECRERFLNRRPAKQAPPKSAAASKEPTRTENPQREPFPTPPSHERVDFLKSKLLRPQLIITALHLALTVIVVFLPPLLNNLLAPLVVTGAALLRAVLNIIRDRRFGTLRIIDGLALPVAIFAVLSTVFFGPPSKTYAVLMALLLTIDSMGRLFELIGRHRSGVLFAVDNNQSVALPESWKDNSTFAEKTKRFAIILEWGRYPIALGLGALTYFATTHSITDGLLTFATALLAVHPRTIRMATGDAHLAAALMASKMKIAVRDAHAVDALSRARIAIFMAKQCLLKTDRHVVDWETIEGTHEQNALDALYTVQSIAKGRTAEAITHFTASKGARATGTPEITHDEKLGIIGATPWGTVVVGKRALLLRENIVTGLLEPQAKKIEQSGRRAVFYAIDGRLAAVFGIEERLVNGAEEAVSALRHQGMETALTISAEPLTAESLGQRLGVDAAHFEVDDAKLGAILQGIDERGDSAVLIGRGASFEEHLRAATASIAFNNSEGTQAGFDTKINDIGLLPKLIGMTRRAGKSAVINLILGMGALLFSLGFSVSWFSPVIVLLAGTLSSAVAAAETFNAPYPLINQIARRIASPFHWTWGYLSNAIKSRR